MIDPQDPADIRLQDIGVPVVGELRAAVPVSEYPPGDYLFRTELARGSDESGREFVVCGSASGRSLFLERPGLPTRAVYLNDLVAAMLAARPREVQSS
jgi:hypothetical protein